jgi:dihydrofolate reductase
MRNGTTFHFIDASPQEVLRLAASAAGGEDVALGGGAATIRQFLGAGLVDELHMVIVPVLLGDGERLFEPGLGGLAGYSCPELTCSAGVAHAVITRASAP